MRGEQNFFFKQRFLIALIQINEHTKLKIERMSRVQAFWMLAAIIKAKLIRTEKGLTSKRYGFKPVFTRKRMKEAVQKRMLKKRNKLLYPHQFDNICTWFDVHFISQGEKWKQIKGWKWTQNVKVQRRIFSRSTSCPLPLICLFFMHWIWFLCSLTLICSF